MDQTLRDAQDVAGVICPKRINEMDWSESCGDCVIWRSCWNALTYFLEDKVWMKEAEG